MPDGRALHRLAVVVAAMLLAPAGLVGAALSMIGRAATVDVQAVRGAASQVDQPEKPMTTPYGLPVAHAARAGWSDTHVTYPATDVFAGCGARLISPVWGTVLEIRRVDSYDPAIDHPATRGGRYVSILGFDGVRYYLAHLDTIVDDLAAGDEVTLGQDLGTMGDTGRTSVCHLHFSISPPCPGKEWSVRRGVIWPHTYLDAWRAGRHLSPAPAVADWLAAHPTACAEAMADPFAGDS